MTPEMKALNDAIWEVINKYDTMQGGRSFSIKEKEFLAERLHDTLNVETGFMESRAA